MKSTTSPPITTTKLSKINSLLLGLIIIINLYVITAPFVPALLFGVASHGNKRQQLTDKIKRAPITVPAPAASSAPNHVIIPSMLLDAPIHEGTVANQYKTLNDGIWRWPRGSTPDKGGNTVLIGHRFTYTNPQGVFYYLNKVKIGDEMGMDWGGQVYRYRVTSVRTVPANDTSIEDTTQDSRLTLFTCTPLWLPKERLVVIANLETKL